MYQRHATVRNNAFHSTYLADRIGRAATIPTGEFEAGSFTSITLTYTAGYFGIDDTGSLKIVRRFARTAHADVPGAYFRVQGPGGCVRHLQLRGAAGAAGRFDRRRATGTL